MLNCGHETGLQLQRMAVALRRTGERLKTALIRERTEVVHVHAPLNAAMTYHQLMI
jgi:hypothetical protein